MVNDGQSDTEQDASSLSVLEREGSRAGSEQGAVLEPATSCPGHNRDGRPCGAAPLPGQRYCLAHSQDPETRARRLAGHAEGGKQRWRALRQAENEKPAWLKKTVPPWTMDDVGQVKGVIAIAVSMLLTGRLSAKDLNAISVAARVALEACAAEEASVLKRALAVLEERK